MKRGLRLGEKKKEKLFVLNFQIMSYLLFTATESAARNTLFKNVTLDIHIYNRHGNSVKITDGVVKAAS